MSAIERLERLRDDLGQDGYWNYDPYNFGLYHGVALSVSIMKNEVPLFKDVPENWECEDSDVGPISFL